MEELSQLEGREISFLFLCLFVMYELEFFSKVTVFSFFGGVASTLECKIMRVCCHVLSHAQLWMVCAKMFYDYSLLNLCAFILELKKSGNGPKISRNDLVFGDI